ncbi:extracellular solute-binding protein [Cohnella lubricantis]|uniref:Extracellular solute-binding protein n=1 Tax=Cohnella lubricantis TaxID=2163172 RepID=A0A841TE72_9BACL|nr:extracellular solute-binding protein [Cohnella lubricantis]MBB6679584.1 extracellular solute-binding protein [Cohnella lubricantis]MBP2120567.1 raffinose/stachyose/melibiose transport system substrate-binding protein [Cohnella lubricantis]
MHKKLVSSLAVSMAMSAFLAACGSNDGNNTSSPSASPSESASPSPSASPSESASPEKVENFTVSLRHIQIGDAQKFRKAILDDVVAKTEAEVPGLKFELDPVEDQVNRFTKLPAEMAAGNPPKIFDVFGGAGDTQKYAAAGRMLDLTPILDELGIKDKFLSGVLEPFSVDGKVYGLPIGGNTEGIFYNTELFAQYNLNPPTTWDDLIKAADTLKANDITPFAMGSSGAWVPNMLVNTLIGRVAGEKTNNGFITGEVKWNSPDVLAAYQLYADWEKAGYFSKGELGKDYDGMLNDFVAGKAGMMFDGSWRSSAFKNDAVGGAIAGKVAFVSLPAVPNGKGDQTSVNANYANGYGFSSDVNENEKKAITAFIKNLYSDEMQLRGLLEDGVLPSMKLSEASVAQVSDPVVKQVLDVLANAGASFPHFDSVVQSKVYTETETQLAKLIAGKATPQQVGDAIQKVQDAENAAAAK